eukprot:jgi/Mesvir1/7972/Mv11878-RA.2
MDVASHAMVPISSASVLPPQAHYCNETMPPLPDDSVAAQWQPGRTAWETRPRQDEKFEKLTLQTFHSTAKDERLPVTGNATRARRDSLEILWMGTGKAGPGGPASVATTAAGVGRASAHGRCEADLGSGSLSMPLSLGVLPSLGSMGSCSGESLYPWSINATRCNQMNGDGPDIDASRNNSTRSHGPNLDNGTLEAGVAKLQPGTTAVAPNLPSPAGIGTAAPQGRQLELDADFGVDGRMAAAAATPWLPATILSHIEALQLVYFSRGWDDVEALLAPNAVRLRRLRRRLLASAPSAPALLPSCSLTERSSSELSERSSSASMDPDASPLAEKSCCAPTEPCSSSVERSSSSVAENSGFPPSAATSGIEHVVSRCHRGGPSLTTGAATAAITATFATPVTTPATSSRGMTSGTTASVTCGVPSGASNDSSSSGGGGGSTEDVSVAACVRPRSGGLAAAPLLTSSCPSAMQIRATGPSASWTMDPSSPSSAVCLPEALSGHSVADHAGSDPSWPSRGGMAALAEDEARAGGCRSPSSSSSGAAPPLVTLGSNRLGEGVWSVVRDCTLAPGTPQGEPGMSLQAGTRDGGDAIPWTENEGNDVGVTATTSAFSATGVNAAFPATGAASYATGVAGVAGVPGVPSAPASSGLMSGGALACPSLVAPTTGLTLAAAPRNPVSQMGADWARLWRRLQGMATSAAVLDVSVDTFFDMVSESQSLPLLVMWSAHGRGVDPCSRCQALLPVLERAGALLLGEVAVVRVMPSSASLWEPLSASLLPNSRNPTSDTLVSERGTTAVVGNHRDGGNSSRARVGRHSSDFIGSSIRSSRDGDEGASTGALRGRSLSLQTLDTGNDAKGMDVGKGKVGERKKVEGGESKDEDRTNVGAESSISSGPNNISRGAYGIGRSGSTRDIGSSHRGRAWAPTPLNGGTLPPPRSPAFHCCTSPEHRSSLQVYGGGQCLGEMDWGGSADGTGCATAEDLVLFVRACGLGACGNKASGGGGGNGGKAAGKEVGPGRVRVGTGREMIAGSSGSGGGIHAAGNRWHSSINLSSSCSCSCEDACGQVGSRGRGGGCASSGSGHDMGGFSWWMSEWIADEAGVDVTRGSNQVVDARGSGLDAKASGQGVVEASRVGDRFVADASRFDVVVAGPEATMTSACPDTTVMSSVEGVATVTTSTVEGSIAATMTSTAAIPAALMMSATVASTMAAATTACGAMSADASAGSGTMIHGDADVSIISGCGRMGGASESRTLATDTPHMTGLQLLPECNGAAVIPETPFVGLSAQMPGTLGVPSALFDECQSKSNRSGVADGGNCVADGSNAVAECQRTAHQTRETTAFHGGVAGATAVMDAARDASTLVKQWEDEDRGGAASGVRHQSHKSASCGPHHSISGSRHQSDQDALTRVASCSPRQSAEVYLGADALTPSLPSSPSPRGTPNMDTMRDQTHSITSGDAAARPASDTPNWIKLLKVPWSMAHVATTAAKREGSCRPLRQHGPGGSLGPCRQGGAWTPCGARVARALPWSTPQHVATTASATRALSQHFGGCDSYVGKPSALLPFSASESSLSSLPCAWAQCATSSLPSVRCARTEGNETSLSCSPCVRSGAADGRLSSSPCVRTLAVGSDIEQQNGHHRGQPWSTGVRAFVGHSQVECPSLDIHPTGHPLSSAACREHSAFPCHDTDDDGRNHDDDDVSVSGVADGAGVAALPSCGQEPDGGSSVTSCQTKSQCMAQSGTDGGDNAACPQAPSQHPTQACPQVQMRCLCVRPPDNSVDGHHRPTGEATPPGPHGALLPAPQGFVDGTLTLPGLYRSVAERLADDTGATETPRTEVARTGRRLVFPPCAFSSACAFSSSCALSCCGLAPSCGLSCACAFPSPCPDACPHHGGASEDGSAGEATRVSVGCDICLGRTCAVCQHHHACDVCEQEHVCGAGVCGMLPLPTPTMIFLGGGAGSGKTTVANVIAGTPFWEQRGEGVVVVETDALMLHDPRYQQGVFHGLSGDETGGGSGDGDEEEALGGDAEAHVDTEELWRLTGDGCWDKEEACEYDLLGEQYGSTKCDSEDQSTKDHDRGGRGSDNARVPGDGVASARDGGATCENGHVARPESLAPEPAAAGSSDGCSCPTVSKSSSFSSSSSQPSSQSSSARSSSLDIHELHESAMATAQDLLVVAVNQGRDVLFDGTMAWSPFITQTIAMLRDGRHLYRRGPGYVTRRRDGRTKEIYWVIDEEATAAALGAIRASRREARRRRRETGRRRNRWTGEVGAWNGAGRVLKASAAGAAGAPVPSATGDMAPLPLDAAGVASLPFATEGMAADGGSGRSVNAAAPVAVLEGGPAAASQGGRHHRANGARGADDPSLYACCDAHASLRRPGRGGKGPRPDGGKGGCLGSGAWGWGCSDGASEDCEVEARLRRGQGNDVHDDEDPFALPGGADKDAHVNARASDDRECGGVHGGSLNVRQGPWHAQDGCLFPLKEGLHTRRGRAHEEGGECEGEDEEEDEDYLDPATLVRPPYRVEMVGVTAAPLVAVKRGLVRQLIASRSVPLPALLRSHRLFSSHFLDYAAALDGMVLFENSSSAEAVVAAGGRPRLLAFKSAGEGSVSRALAGAATHLQAHDDDNSSDVASSSYDQTDYESAAAGVPSAACPQAGEWLGMAASSCVQTADLASAAVATCLLAVPASSAEKGNLGGLFSPMGITLGEASALPPQDGGSVCPTSCASARGHAPSGIAGPSLQGGGSSDTVVVTSQPMDGFATVTAASGHAAAVSDAQEEPSDAQGSGAEHGTEHQRDNSEYGWSHVPGLVVCDTAAMARFLRNRDINDDATGVDTLFRK